AELPGHPFFQVQFPRRILRVSLTPNLLPTQHLDPGRLHEPDRPGFACAVAGHAGEYPVAIVRALEVFLPDPLPALAPVPFPTPAPEFPEDAIVHRCKDATAHGKTVVQGPALDLLIQALDHVACRPAP